MLKVKSGKEPNLQLYCLIRINSLLSEGQQNVLKGADDNHKQTRRAKVAVILLATQNSP